MFFCFKPIKDTVSDKTIFVRDGKMCKSLSSAKRKADKTKGYVHEYGRGVVYVAGVMSP